MLVCEALHRGNLMPYPFNFGPAARLHCRDDSSGHSGVTSVSQRPTRRRKGVIHLPADHSSLTTMLIFQSCTFSLNSVWCSFAEHQ